MSVVKVAKWQQGRRIPHLHSGFGRGCSAPAVRAQTRFLDWFARYHWLAQWLAARRRQQPRFEMCREEKHCSVIAEARVNSLAQGQWFPERCACIRVPEPRGSVRRRCEEHRASRAEERKID